MDELNLSLPESGLGGTVYGAAAVTAAAFIAITHAQKLNYNKLLSLIISAFLNGAALILVSIAKDKVPTSLCISQLKSNYFLTSLLANDPKKLQILPMVYKWIPCEEIIKQK